MKANCRGDIDTAPLSPVPEAREEAAPAASATQRLVNVQQLRHALTWLGWPRDLVASELESMARRG